VPIPIGGRRDSQRGAATVQLVVATPALLLLVMLVVQMALWQHGTHVVAAAAAQSVTDAQAESGSAAAARRSALSFLTRAGRGLVETPRVDVVRTSREARVVIRATAIELVPGLRLPLVGRASGPVERFRPPSER